MNMIHTLYVDDEPDLLEIGKLFLERSRDIAIDTDLSAKNALGKAKSGRYDAIISDYVMPEMDGISLLKEVRKSGCTIPFILFTGRGREEVVIDALNNGADFYLQKGGNPRAQFAELRSMLIQAVERRNVEARLKNSEERYRNVVEDQTEAICRFRSDSTHVFVNSAYCNLVGKNKDELIGKKFTPNIPNEDLAKTHNFLRSLTPENPKGYMTQCILMPDGSKRWLRCNDRAIFDDHGSIIEYQSVSRDITEQKKAEDALVDSQRTLQYIIDLMPDAMYGIDRCGRVIVWNKAAEHMTGVAGRDLIGKTDYEHAVPFYGERIPTLVDCIIHPESASTLYEHVQKTEGTTLISESHATFADGRTTNLWIKACPLFDHDGKISGAISVIRDISNYKQLEAALLQSNRKLSLMSSVTRHGILNKLCVLNVYLDLIRTDTSPQQVSDRLSRIESTVNAIRDQISSTWQYQNIGMKAPLWHTASDSFCSAISQVDIKNLHCSDKLAGLELRADPMLEQVFVNLIENTVFHSPGATEVTCSYEKTETGVSVLYEDNGEGIPVPEKNLVFMEGHGKNNGLGLYYVQQILSITGITVKETGEYGKGVRFELSVPEGHYIIHPPGFAPHPGTSPNPAPFRKDT